MQKVLCFGELLLRLSPESNGNWIKKNAMPVYIGGSELNVATALAKWNVPVKYFTALPENYLSREICNDLKGKGIDIDKIIFSGNRIGIYYLPQGTDLKHTGVIYDRSHSSFSELKVGMIDWNQVLQGVLWFHFSAITPALNVNAAAVCKEALIAASGTGIKISVDLNYRNKLWQYGKQPNEIMPQLVEHCDVVMGNIWAANNLLGIPVDLNIHEKKNKSAYLEHATKTANNIMSIFPKCRSVSNTFRFDDEGGIKYFASLNTEGSQFVSKELFTNKVIDKVGSGDCFMAGLIYGFYNNLQSQQIIDFASAAAFNKFFITGDSTTSTEEEIKNIYQDHG